MWKNFIEERFLWFTILSVWFWQAILHWWSVTDFRCRRFRNIFWSRLRISCLWVSWLHWLFFIFSGCITACGLMRERRNCRIWSVRASFPPHYRRLDYSFSVSTEDRPYLAVTISFICSCWSALFLQAGFPTGFCVVWSTRTRTGKMRFRSWL